MNAIREEARALAHQLLPLVEEAKRLDIYGNHYLSDDWRRIHPELSKLNERLASFLTTNDVEILVELARDA